MDNALADLIRISNTTGSDPTLTQGAGGNTSVKTNDGKYMFIKASGTALKNMNAKRGWRKVRLNSLLKVIKNERLAGMPAEKRESEVVNQLLLACDDDMKSQGRPSVESYLHALLDKCVIHLHPVVIGAFVNAKKGRQAIKKLFKNEKYPPLWIPYAPPGFMTARKVARFVAGYQNRYGRKPTIMFLAKHGLFVTAPAPDAAITITKRVIKKCKSILPKSKLLRLNPPANKDVRLAKFAIRKAISDITGLSLPVSHFFNKNIASFINHSDAAKLLAKGALGAAELTYANGPPIWIETPLPEKISVMLKKLIRKTNRTPKAFIVNGLGLFIAADRKIAPAIADVATASLIVRDLASHFGGLLTLTPAEQNFIIKWELESSGKGV